MKSNEKMNKLTKEEVVLTWLNNGIKDLYFAFQFDVPRRYKLFFTAMGIEKVCKSFLLAEKSSKYENLCEKQAMKEINKIAKKYNHKLKEMIFTDICNSTGCQDLIKIQTKKYDTIKQYDLTGEQYDLTGKVIIDCLEKAYDESRYPVPEYYYEKFPLKVKSDKTKEKKIYWDPSGSSEIDTCCYEITSIIIFYLNKIHKISVTQELFDNELNLEKIKKSRIYRKDAFLRRII